MAAASLLAEDILAEEPGAVDRALDLFRAGGSDDAHTLLRKAGVDMTTADPYDALARRMESIITEMESLLDRIGE